MIIDKCLVKFPEKEDFLINPIIDYYTILEKVNFKVVYNTFFRKNLVIKQCFGTYPVYFPETGYLLALETISPNLTSDLYNVTKDFERYYSDEKVIRTCIYNHNKEMNRFVTRGNYCSSKLPEKYYKLYIFNLINDLMLTPSIVKPFGLISPNRWFVLESRKSYYFKTEINYNVGIIYLSKQALEKSRTISLWWNSPLEVLEIPAGFVSFTKDGKMIYKDGIRVHFLKNPLEQRELPSDKGEYFICFLLSLNDYETNYPKFNQIVRKKVNINLVENLTELIYSPYEIIPFMFPHVISSIQMKCLVFEFEIKKDALRTIIRRLMKFSSIQHPDLIDTYNNILENQNRLFTISEEGEKLKIDVVNPAVIPFLVKEYISQSIGRSRGREEILENFVTNPTMAIEKLKDIQNNPKDIIMWDPLRCIERVLDLRCEMLRQYAKIWAQNVLLDSF